MRQRHSERKERKKKERKKRKERHGDDSQVMRTFIGESVQVKGRHGTKSVFCSFPAAFFSF